MQIFPTTLARWLARNIDNASVLYIQQFTQAPPKFVVLTVDTSPFSYTAKEPGFISVVGGIITDFDLKRGADTIHFVTALATFIPVSINDIVVISYTDVPTFYFIPIYGAAQR